MNVKFLAGTRAQYNGLSEKPVTTFYYLSDEKAFYLGDVRLDNADVLALIGTLPEGYSDVVSYIDALIDGITTGAGYATTTWVEGQISASEEILKKYTDDAIAALGIDDYAKTADIAGSLAKAESALQAAALEPYSTTEEMNAELAKKQDTLVFATAYDAENNKAATMKDIAAEVAKILNDADPSDIDTLEEIAAWIASHPDSVAALNAAIEQNKTDIAAINAKLPDGTIADTDDVAAAKSGAEATAAAALDAYKGEAATAHQALENSIAGVKATADAAATQESLDALSDIVTENKEAADATQAELTAHKEAYEAYKTSHAEELAAVSAQANKGVADAATAQAAAEAAQSTADSKATLAEVKDTYIGETNAKLVDVVKAVNQLNDGVEDVGSDLKNINNNVTEIVNQLTWGTIA